MEERMLDIMQGIRLYPERLVGEEEYVKALGVIGMVEFAPFGTPRLTSYGKREFERLRLKLNKY